MMFKQMAKRDGEKNGREDTCAGRKFKPRPSLQLSVISPTYLDHYVQTYTNSFRDTTRAISMQKVRDDHLKAQNEAVLKLTETAKSRPFEYGWKDGFTGKEASVSMYGHTIDRDAYKRGYKIGVRDRDYARAKALREKMSRRHEDRDSQAELDREF